MIAAAKTLTLRDVIRVEYGSALKQNDRDESGPFTVYGSSGPVGRHSESLVEHPTIIIGRKGSVGAVTYAPDGGWPIDTAYFVRPLDAKKIDLRYLYYFLCDADLAANAITTSIPGLNRDTLYSTPIPLPPQSEQKRIAAILDKADAIRRKRRAALLVSDQLPGAIFFKIMGGQIPKAGSGSPTMSPLDPHLEFLTSGSRGWAEHYAKTGKRFIRSLDVQMNRISGDDCCFVNPPPGTEADRTRVRDGDVLLTVTGSRIGRVAFVPTGFGEAYVSQHVAIMRLKSSLRPRFLSMFLSLADGGQRQIRKAQYGQTKPGLSLEQIRRFEVPVLSIEKQDRFCSAWVKFGAAESHASSALANTEQLFASLVQRAFRGELE